MRLKDESLAAAAATGNVAQFVSFSPGDLDVRHSAIIGLRDHPDPRGAVAQLLAQSASGAVNVRSFRPGNNRGNPFNMGLQQVDDVLAMVTALAKSGFYTIVNESIDVNDGGVSGVRWNGWTEFAPKDTPRCVEKPGTAGLPSEAADQLFELVYHTQTPLNELAAGYRVEFSIHPTPVGYRQTRTIIWEVSEEPSDQVLEQNVEWPNRFSEFLGDKAYGLLVASVFGFQVPRTQVIARDIAPFEFGVENDFDSVWTRTCPRRFSPGEFPTLPSYVDVFKLLADCDPSGDAIGSVLIQRGVRPWYSGAVSADTHQRPIVSGVQGEGANYMLGLVPPDELPPAVIDEATLAFDHLSKALGGPCRFEWVHDDQRLWLVQLNRDLRDGFNVSEGDATSWVRFDPADGVDVLRELINDVAGKSVGVELSRPVGLTSHVGDLLRLAGVPARVPGLTDNLQGSR